MSIVSLAKCIIGRHKPIRRKVEWSDGRYVGDCRHCGKPIKRVGYGQWRSRSA